MSSEAKYEINADCCFDSRHRVGEITILREYLYKRFSNQITLLLESKRPRKTFSTKGKVSTRKLYQYPFNDSIFTQTSSVPSSDTTLVMLIDASSSMESSAFDMFGNDYSCMEVSTAISSAFAKAVRECVSDEIKIEVFLKTCSNQRVKGSLGLEGAPVELIRVYSNTKRKDCDLDKMLTATTNSPLQRTDYGSGGSATPEFAVLPALFNWITDNVTTKNICIFNITDGDTYSQVGHQGFGNADTRIMREKYLRHVNNITLYIGREIENRDKEIYGDNIVGNSTGDSTSFIQPMFNTLMKIFNSTTE